MSKTLEQRVEDLERAVAGIPQRGRFLEQYEQELVEAARNYARVTAHDYYMERGERTAFWHTEKTALQDMFLDRMKVAALKVEREMALEEKR